MSTKERVGVIVSDKMNKTVIVAVANRVVYPKYGKTVIKTKRYKAHVEKDLYQVGDTVRIQETRPLSRTKRWKVVTVVSKAQSNLQEN